MVENISLTKYQVETLENIADLLDSIDYSKEGAEIKFLALIVNIESLLPKSNIFDYVIKTDITKDKKLDLQKLKKQKFEIINENVELLKSLPGDIENKWTQVSDYYNVIKENEEKYNGEIDILYDKIKESQDELYGKIDKHNSEIEINNGEIDILYDKMKESQDELYGKIDNHNSEIEIIYNEIKKIDDELYGKIDINENEKNDIVNKTYDEIKGVELNIEDIHTKMNEMASENNVLYVEIENIDYEISQIDNYIEKSEWKIELDSHEEVTFNKIKEKLIIEKKFNYGNI